MSISRPYGCLCLVWTLNLPSARPKLVKIWLELRRKHSELLALGKRSRFDYEGYELWGNGSQGTRWVVFIVGLLVNSLTLGTKDITICIFITFFSNSIYFHWLLNP